MIGDFIWEDTDRDGLQDPGEPGLPGIEVCLFNADTNALIDCTTTGWSWSSARSEPGSRKQPASSRAAAPVAPVVVGGWTGGAGGRGF